jgi:cyclomaltodextrinase
VGIAGWRLDVAGEVEVGFWEEFRRACEAARPDSVLVGELIHGNYTRCVCLPHCFLHQFLSGQG